MLSKDYRCNVIRGNKVSGNMHCIRK